MKRVGLFVLAGVLVLWSVGAASAWQGRMAGMGDPYGLIEDESDFLVNPAKIADLRGEEPRTYLHYRFQYGNVSPERSLATADPNPELRRSVDGDVLDHWAQAGEVLPLWNGKLGAFFSYRGHRSDLEGTEGANANSYPVGSVSDLDTFTLKLLYGQSVSSGVNIGLGLDVSYVDMERGNSINTMTNEYYDVISYPLTFFPLTCPLDSRYWEIGGTAGVECEFGTTTLGLTMRGGAAFGGDNSWDSSLGFNLDGGVNESRIGGELWARHRLSPSISLPFLVRVDYVDLSWDADQESLSLSSNGTQRRTALEAGGGIDYAVSRDTRVAAGLYYNFIRSDDDFSFTRMTILTYNHTRYPGLTEHLARLVLAGETRLSALWVARSGLTVFGGAAEEKYDFDMGVLNTASRTSADGTHWGITGYLGATTKFGPVSFEPFVYAGYQELYLNDDSSETRLGDQVILRKLNEVRRETQVGVGFSLLF